MKIRTNDCNSREMQRLRAERRRYRGTNPNEVKPGDWLYVDSSYYCDSPEADIEGGLAEVEKILLSDHLPELDENYYMVSFKRLRPNQLSFNLRMLLEEQAELKKKFGIEFAHGVGIA